VAPTQPLAYVIAVVSLSWLLVLVLAPTASFYPAFSWAYLSRLSEIFRHLQCFDNRRRLVSPMPEDPQKRIKELEKQLKDWSSKFADALNEAMKKVHTRLEEIEKKIGIKKK
jgi:hypothetical protein